MACESIVKQPNIKIGKTTLSVIVILLFLWKVEWIVWTELFPLQLLLTISNASNGIAFYEK